jgi:glutamate-ammonia-ligase adenylyltransferase
VLTFFQVKPPTGSTSEIWDQFEAQLSDLVSEASASGVDVARANIIESFTYQADDVQADDIQLYKLDIEIDTDSFPDSTLLTIGTQDTPGFLFSFTTALAVLDVNINRAEIRTVDGTVEDRLWLTDSAGRKITSASGIRELRVAAALIKQFTHLLPRSPNPQLALSQFNALIHQVLSQPNWTGELDALESPQVLETLAEMMGVSQFLWEDFLRMQHANLFPVVLDTPSLDGESDRIQLDDAVNQGLESESDHESRVRFLNRFKDREMFRIDLRHITDRIDHTQFSKELTGLAEVIVSKAAELAYDSLRDRYGQPTLENGAPCEWGIFALGKVGGIEIGFGSDIEMIFLYEAEGETTGPEQIRNSSYFGELVKRFLQTLDARREGIFEVDLRLRPYGNKGALAPSLDAFQSYYRDEGDARQFERLALVKMRPVFGSSGIRQRALAIRDQFVYSPLPLDVENIIHLRERQSTELMKRGTLNAKHSPGGVVDIEYYVQAWQVCAGRTEPSVRGSNTLASIRALQEMGFLASEHAQRVSESYSFLRRLIDALRVVRGNAKDLTVPPEDSREFSYLAQRLKYESAQQLSEAISDCMAYAADIWNRQTPPL